MGIGLGLVTASGLTGCHAPGSGGVKRWSDACVRVADVPPITFHYDHGVLAGSYPGDKQTVAIEFDDVCSQLGHVCLCGAGGFRIAGKIVDAIQGDGPPLERDDFVLISGRDHSVSDVVAFVLGCTRRLDPAKNHYFIDDSITAPRREYHYYVTYAPTRKAVHVVYRKHLLIGHEKMDELWQIELAFDRDPSSVSAADVKRYREAMKQMVADVLHDNIPGLITVEPIPYEEKGVRSH